MKKLLAIFLLLVGIAFLAAVAGILLAGKGPALSGSTVLVWHLDRPVVEQGAPSLPFTGRANAESIAELYPALRAARQDRGVRGIAVYIDEADFGLAKAQELRRQLLAFQAAGKFVECYLETAGEGGNGTLGYYLATACGRIRMAPAGELNLLGLYSDNPFLKGTLDKLKIDPDFNHVGEYKSAAESFTETRNSPAAARAINAVLDSVYGQLVAAIAEARHLPAETVRRLIDDAPYSAAEARQKGLIDGLAYPDEFHDRFAALAGGRPRLQSLDDYDGRSAFAGRRLAVVMAPGTIVRGTGGAAPWSGEGALGSEEMAALLRRVGRDGSIAAVVLRVDSPGGSALASDLILREVELLKRKKPVVVSMSDLAASGGYYIASKASRIVAEPATLTGSIGVVGGKFATRRFQEQILGITHDALKRGANADLYAALDAYSPQQEARIQAAMRRVYDTFVGHVAAGRHMSRAAVLAVAGGRVWTGADAKPLGLVDELGGLDRAIELARREAGIAAGESLGLAFYPEPKSWLELFGRRREPLLPASLARLAQVLDPRSNLLELPPELTALARPF